MKKRIGLIGAGEFGNFAASVMSMLPGFNLVAVADTNEKSANTLAKNYHAKVYKYYLDLLKDKNVDIVLINTPNFLHSKMVEDALNYGKKIMCEKPLGINENEIIGVKKCLIKNKGVLIVNYLLPRSGIYQRLKDIIQSKIYGNLKYIHIENLATESTIKSKWYWQKEKSGGWFLTADIHFYDLANFLLENDAMVVTAKEYIKNNRTDSILTNLEIGNTRIDIFHDFSAGYKRVSFHARFIFDNADISVEGWIPTKMEIKTAEGIKTIKEKKDRDVIYQGFVAENIRELSKMNHHDSMSHVGNVIKGSKVAFEAQEITDRNGE